MFNFRENLKFLYVGSLLLFIFFIGYFYTKNYNDKIFYPDSIGFYSLLDMYEKNEKNRTDYIYILGTHDPHIVKNFILNYIDTLFIKTPATYYEIIFLVYNEGMPMVENSRIEKYLDKRVCRLFIDKNSFSAYFIDNKTIYAQFSISIEDFQKANRKKFILERMKYAE
jgi:hypothetical protein